LLQAQGQQQQQQQAQRGQRGGKKQQAGSGDDSDFEWRQSTRPRPATRRQRATNVSLQPNLDRWFDLAGLLGGVSWCPMLLQRSLLCFSYTPSLPGFSDPASPPRSASAGGARVHRPDE
jgi:hypothetical protein